MTETDAPFDKTWPMIVYVLYLASLVSGVLIISITAVIGMVIAYVNGTDPDERLRTHYRFQIRTFWIGLLYTVLGSITFPVGIGVLILIWAVVWLIIRCVKGMVALNEGRAHPEPASWMFG
ncbi:DUF4870 family protein [Vreelandella utahensis]|uniref:DUF4870 family protein n=1 Tax=Vreelandella halophila TaxID=86177 RepID=UPI000984CB5F|nr:hypothetical protein [Halomonas utahensis]